MNEYNKDGESEKSLRRRELVIHLWYILNTECSLTAVVGGMNSSKFASKSLCIALYSCFFYKNDIITLLMFITFSEVIWSVECLKNLLKLLQKKNEYDFQCVFSI